MIVNISRLAEVDKVAVMAHLKKFEPDTLDMLVNDLGLKRLQAQFGAIIGLDEALLPVDLVVRKKAERLEHRRLKTLSKARADRRYGQRKRRL